MEDAHITNENIDGNGTGLFCVFDGHGGIEAAKFCERHFTKTLLANANYQKKQYSTALEETFLELDTMISNSTAEMHQISRDFPPAMTPLKRASQMQGMKNNKQLQNLLKEESKEEQNMEERGCTANVLLFVPEDSSTNTPPMLYCANAGDSRSVLGSLGKATALSFDHKPTNPTERTRIQRAGGFVNGEGRVNGNLNLSRAIGDLTYKKNKRIPAKEQQITSFPDVRAVPLTAKVDFVVMGCDGIWEFHTNQ